MAEEVGIEIEYDSDRERKLDNPGGKHTGARGTINETADPDPTGDEVKKLEAKDAEPIQNTKETDNRTKEVDAAVPVAPRAGTPPGEDIDKHVARGHANCRRWRPDCQRGTAQRTPHRSNDKGKGRRNNDGEGEVAQTEDVKSGWTTISI